MKAELKFHGGEALAEVRAKGWEALMRAVVFYHSKLLEAVNIPSSRPYWKASPPGNRIAGQPPKKRSGFGQRNIVYELDEPKGEARVGVKANAKYMAFLELGTRKMLARPWLLATLKKFWETIKGLAQAE